eukprot:1553494-Prymnesium_polylepis.1
MPHSYREINLVPPRRGMPHVRGSTSHTGGYKLGSVATGTNQSGTSGCAVRTSEHTISSRSASPLPTTHQPYARRAR